MGKLKVYDLLEVGRFDDFLHGFGCLCKIWDPAQASGKLLKKLAPAQKRCFLSL